MPTYVVELAFDKDNDRRLEVRPSHRDYLQRLHAEGRLVTAGPFADDTGALLVYRVGSRDELADVLDADPYTATDVVSWVGIREWVPIIPPAN
ncbi:MAG TPA: YciI family protein [Jiangellaceae bacterium]|nr:YciI family protein [Jiangellaceae bacterium]